MRELVLGNLIDGLYQLLNLPSNSCSPTALASHISDSAIWHKRLGHIPSSVMSKISGLDIHCTTDKCDPCYVCLLAKQCKLPFASSSSIAAKPFDLVHCDIWGPYRISSYNGCRYFLTVVDDYSRGLWTILLPTKQHDNQSLKDFFNYVHTQFSTTIKCLRTDNGCLHSCHHRAPYTTLLVRTPPTKWEG